MANAQAFTSTVLELLRYIVENADKLLAVLGALGGARLAVGLARGAGGRRGGGGGGATPGRGFGALGGVGAGVLGAIGAGGVVEAVQAALDLRGARGGIRDARSETEAPAAPGSPPGRRGPTPRCPRSWMPTRRRSTSLCRPCWRSCAG